MNANEKPVTKSVGFLRVVYRRGRGIDPDWWHPFTTGRPSGGTVEAPTPTPAKAKPQGDILRQREIQTGISEYEQLAAQVGVMPRWRR